MSQIKNNANILVVEDDEDDFIILSEYLHGIKGRSFSIDWSKNYHDALKQLTRGAHDLYFVDYRLGARSGVDFLKEARQLNLEKPIVLLTGKGNYEVDIQAMQLGAVDYLIKTDLSSEKLERCIRYSLERAANIKALTASERKYRSIFEKSKDVVFVTDAELNFIDVNRTISNLLGYEPAEITSLNLCDLVDHDHHRKYLRQMLQSKGEVNDWETVLRTKDGERKYCILTATTEDSGQPDVYVQGIIHDITNLKKMENAKLQGEKLAAAGRLVRTIAHEVRNPLNNITLSVEQLQHLITDEHMCLYMNIIQRNGKRINDLISELLNTSHPANNALEKQTLQQIIDDVITASIDRLTLKHIQLKVSYPNEALLVMADKEKLKLALLNIVINAVEAMEEHTGVLSLGLVAEGDKGVLTITDNGCGISEENVSHLFEPYFTQKRNGVGLGLTFTLNILQAHQANIDVSSEPGKGTTFTITFPLA